MGLIAMTKYFKLILTLLLAAVMAGCTASGNKLSVDEAANKSDDDSKPFIFVETPILNIDSDLMASGFGTDQRSGTKIIMDSAYVLKVVYDILLDSILGIDADTFNLAVEQPNLYRQYEQLRGDRVMRLMYKEIIVDSVSISDSDIEAAYEEQKDSFRIPEMYRARHIVMAGEGIAHSFDSSQYTGMTDEQLDSIAHDRMAGLRDRILNGDNFDTLAMLYSQDVNSAPKGGDLGYFQLSQMVSPFDSVVEFTPVGEVSGLVKTEFGWHVVKVEDHAMEHFSPIDSVSTQLKEKLLENAVISRSRVYVDSLINDADIRIDTVSMMIADSLHKSDDILAYVNPDDHEFGNDTVFFKDYEEQLFAYKKYKRIDGDLAPAEKEELIKSVATRILLYETSHKLGYYNDPDIEKWAETTVKKYSVSTLRKRFMEEKFEPTEEAMRAYYDSHLEDYRVERPVTVQHIVFADSNMAEHVRDLLTSGVDFMEMVDQYYPGDPDIRRAAADLGEIGPDDMPQEFFATAMRTPVDGISSPVKTKYGYHLIKVLDKKYSITFDQAKIKIKSILSNEHLKNRIKAYVDSRLDSPPVIHWELARELYYEDRQVPDFSQFRSKP